MRSTIVRNVGRGCREDRRMKEYIITEANQYEVEMSRYDELPELIRCKDCKFSSPNQVYGCRIHSFADDLDIRLYADDFCSMAERKEE